MAEKKKYRWGARLILVLVIAAALGVSLIWESKINDALGFAKPEITGSVRDSIDLDVHFVDVGQGDACIIELPDDRVMLIDSGETDKNDTLIGYIDEHIVKDGKKLESFDIAMVTHSDSDHCGEMGDVLEKYPAKTFYRPNVAANRDGYVDPGIAAGDLYGNYRTKDTLAYRKAIEAGYAGVEALGGDAYATNALDDEQNVIVPENIAPGQPGYYTLTLYTPTVDTYPTDWNNYSPIMILEYEGRRIVLSGDAEKEAEAEFVNLAQEGQGKFSVFTASYSVDLIKLGHHGSRTSSSQAYLDVLTTAGSCQATFAVASCGEGNSYGHPHPETLERLTKMGFKDEHIMRTDVKGSILASVRLNDNYEYTLFVSGVAVAVFAWRWLYVAGIILAAAVLVILIVPVSNSTTGKGRKRNSRRR